VNIDSWAVTMEAGIR